MLIHPTVERLRALGLAAMADAFIELQNAPDAAELPREDWLGLLVDREATSRENKRLARRLARPSCARPPSSRTSTFAPPAASTVLCSTNSPPASGSVTHHHLVVVGPTGIGKSWLGLRPRPQGLPRRLLGALQARHPRLFADLAQARGEGRLPRLLTTLERTRLLIIDDWGPEPLNAEQRRDLLEIVDDRYDKGSLLITSQVPVRMARGHRRSHARRRDPRPHRSPRPSHRAQGRQPAPSGRLRGLFRSSVQPLISHHCTAIEGPRPCQARA